MKMKQILENIIQLGDNFELDGVKIGNTEYKIVITNRRRELYLEFLNPNKKNTKEFYIRISSDNKISFQRHVYRPKHDHDDSQSLQINEKNEFIWSKYPPSTLMSEKMDYFKVDFGPIIDECP